MKISNIDVKGVICLLYYEIGHESPPVLVSETPTNIYVDIEIPIDSLMAGELLITRELQFIFHQSDIKSYGNRHFPSKLFKIKFQSAILYIRGKILELPFEIMCKKSFIFQCMQVTQ